MKTAFPIANLKFDDLENIINRTTNSLHLLLTRRDYLVRFGYEFLDPTPNFLGINLCSQKVIGRIFIILQASSKTYIFYCNAP